MATTSPSPQESPSLPKDPVKKSSKPNKHPLTKSIRALHDTETITLYQAYNPSIAIPAVEQQSLLASPAFLPTRTTWLKPSWNWMLYRSGYSYKDPNQARILAIKMRHADFADLLSRAVVAGHRSSDDNEEGRKDVVVQWDPERTVRIGRVDGGAGNAGPRSIQIGVKGELVRKWAKDWVVGIEDVTARARELKRVLDEDPGVGDEELKARGLIPEETGYDYMLDRSVRARLEMDIDVDGGEEDGRVKRWREREQERLKKRNDSGGGGSVLAS